MFDLPAQSTNAISTEMEEQITIRSTIFRNQWTRDDNSVYHLVADDWKISNSVNLLSIPEIEETAKINMLVEFIQENKLSDFIIACQKHIKLFFPESKIEKETHYDFEEHYTKLFLIINTPLSSKEAFRKGRKMFKNWELVKNSDFNHYVSITTKTI
ncbi:MAG: Unknown protein [uncultured Aureispira sp.]|uniref:Uncharacterized protein n=1 Tax=uncultured Aureispira sp. TaxID=1331704 RepID=A0A6S6THZ5_9BACT|nr:MAG: Unknown protein [uncultured Aureispira sp.]